MSDTFGLPGAMLLLIVAVGAVAFLGWRTIFHRHAARRVAQWTRELLDSGRLMREFTEPVRPGADASTSPLDPQHPEHG